MAFPKLSEIRKAVYALVGTVLTWSAIIAQQTNNFRSITAVEWVALAVAVATALGVYGTVNDPKPPALPEPLAAADAGDPVDAKFQSNA